MTESLRFSAIATFFDATGLVPRSKDKQVTTPVQPSEPLSPAVLKAVEQAIVQFQAPTDSLAARMELKYN